MEDRFWSKVDKTETCWLWRAAITRDGYGQFWDARRRAMVLAHRVAYELTYGPLPPKPARQFGPVGDLVCHRCDTRHCVRPDHLFIGTQDDNMRDMRLKGRSPSNVGGKNPRAKLSSQDVEAIRAGYSGRYGEKSELARRYGVSTAQISKILLGQVWAA